MPDYIWFYASQACRHAGVISPHKRLTGSRGRAHEKARHGAGLFDAELALSGAGLVVRAGGARTRGGGPGKAQVDCRLFVRHGSRGEFRDHGLLVHMETPAKGERRGDDRKCDDGAHN